MNLIKIFLIFLISSSLVLGESAVPLNLGDKAPFEGVLFTTPKAQELKNTLIERDSLKIINYSLNTSINLQTDILTHKDNQIKLIMDQNDNLAKEVYSERSLNSWEKFLWFGVGVLSSVLILYGVKEAAK